MYISQVETDLPAKKVHVYGKKFYAKWTDATAGQSSYSSVLEPGIARYDALCEMAKEGRTEAGLKVESDFLARLREEANIAVWSDEARKKAKRRKSEQRALPEAPRKSKEEAMKGFDGLFNK